MERHNGLKGRNYNYITKLCPQLYLQPLVFRPSYSFRALILSFLPPPSPQRSLLTATTPQYSLSPLESLNARFLPPATALLTFINDYPEESSAKGDENVFCVNIIFYRKGFVV